MYVSIYVCVYICRLLILTHAIYVSRHNSAFKYLSLSEASAVATYDCQFFIPVKQPFFPPLSNASVNHSHLGQPEVPDLNQFHPSNFSTTYIPFTLRHHNSASFATARQQYGRMSYIPLPYFLIVGQKVSFHHSIHNSFFLMLMLLSGDIHVNPGLINGHSNSLCSPQPNFAAVTLPPVDAI